MSSVAALASRHIVPASSPLKRAMSSANKPNASGLSPEQSKSLQERKVDDSEQRIISAIKEVCIYLSVLWWRSYHDAIVQLYSCKPKEVNNVAIRWLIGALTECIVYVWRVCERSGVPRSSRHSGGFWFYSGSVQCLGEGDYISLSPLRVSWDHTRFQLFPRADIPKFRVLRNPDNLTSDTILIDQDVAYYRDPSSSTPTKVFSWSAFYSTLNLFLSHPPQTLNSLLTIKTDVQKKIIKHTEEWNHKRDSTRDDGFFGMLNEQRKKLTASITDVFTSKEAPKQ